MDKNLEVGIEVILLIQEMDKVFFVILVEQFDNPVIGQPFPSLRIAQTPKIANHILPDEASVTYHG